MYQVTIKGRNLAELKKAVSDINTELHQGTSVVKGMERNLEVVEEVKEVEAPVETAAPVVESDTDVEGITWDSRIHSSAKNKTTKGVWKLRRGVDKDLVEQVKAEQKGEVVAQPAPVVEETKVEAPVQEVAQPAPVIEETKVEAPALPAMSTGHTLESFKQNFPMVIGGLITEGKVTQDYINQLKGYFGVAEIWMINDDQKAEVFNGFVQANIISQVG